MNSFSDVDYYIITYPSISKKNIYSDIKNALRAGCTAVQYREKNKTFIEMFKEGKKIKKLCKNKAFFIINDRVDLGLALESDGVHLGQDDMSVDIARKLLGEDKIIGLTVHNVSEALDAEKKGVDYIGVAPIFETDTKKNSRKPCGIDMIGKVREKVSIPIVAVGGIKKDNVKKVVSAGADSIVSVSAVLGSSDVFSEVKDFIDIVRRYKLR